MPCCPPTCTVGYQPAELTVKSYLLQLTTDSYSFHVQTESLVKVTALHHCYETQLYLNITFDIPEYKSLTNSEEVMYNQLMKIGFWLAGMVSLSSGGVEWRATL